MTMQVTTTTPRAILKAIVNIKINGKAIDQAIWQTAVNAVAHAQQHGDCSLVGKLYSAMPKGSRRQTLKSWINEATDIIISNQGKASLDKNDDRFSDPADWNMTYLFSVPWYEYKKEQKIKEFNLQDLRDYLARLESAKNSNSRKYSSEAKEMAKLLGIAMDRVTKEAQKRQPEIVRLPHVA